jgi:hypothetical protein
LVALTSSAALAFAWPMLPPRPVPDAIAGAADPHVAGIFYNPAAIGPLRGVQLWWDQSASLQLGTISRDSGEAQLAGKSAPITSPSIPSFIGATWDLFTDRIVLGLAVMSPFNELTQYPANSAVRYQAIWQRGATLEEVISVGIRVSNRFYIGTSANFAESFIDYRIATPRLRTDRQASTKRARAAATNPAVSRIRSPPRTRACRAGVGALVFPPASSRARSIASGSGSRTSRTSSIRSAAPTCRSRAATAPR